MERNLFSLKKDIEVIQTTKPSWAIEIENKLVDLENRSRMNNLRINGIKEGKNENWEECEERVNASWRKDWEWTLAKYGLNVHTE